MRIEKVNTTGVEIQATPEIHMALRIREGSMQNWNKNTRVYASYSPGDVRLLPGDEPLPTPAYSAQGEDPEADAAWRRYKLAEIAAMKRMLAEAAPLLGMLTVRDVTSLTARFSHKAGCSCGCSPALILDARLSYDGRPVDVTLTRTHDNRPHDFHRVHAMDADNPYYACQRCTTGSYLKEIQASFQTRFISDGTYGLPSRDPDLAADVRDEIADADELGRYESGACDQ
jgi:hypothetical protein